MRILIPMAAATALIAPLGGCMDCSRDPSQVGLGCATVNLTSNVYEEDDALIAAEIAATQSRAAELRYESDRLSAEAARLSGERRAAAGRLARLNHETAIAADRLARLSASHDADQARLRALRDRERELSERLMSLSDDPASASAAELRALEREQEALRRDIDALLGAVS